MNSSDIFFIGVQLITFGSLKSTFYFLLIIYDWFPVVLHFRVYLPHTVSYNNMMLTHWGRVTHICVGKLDIIVSDNGLSPDRREAIIWTNAGMLLIGPSGTSVSEIPIAIHTFSFMKMHFKMSSGKWRPFCLGLNVLNAPVVACYNV